MQKHAIERLFPLCRRASLVAAQDEGQPLHYFLLQQNLVLDAGEVVVGLAD
jgi:hypothetical protein